MISIIICSINAEYLEQVKTNIASTIGVEYELIVHDNRTSQSGLCEIYNQLASRAKFPLLCFVHEDILIQTRAWGRHLADLFQNYPDFGLIGVAGGKYKSKMFSGWYSGNESLDVYNITHRTHGMDHLMRQPRHDGNGFHEVVCIDGVFIACRYEIWNKIRFDDSLLKKFHFYDIDFSIRASAICRTGVTMGIDIIHITSGGDYGEKWVQEAFTFHQARKDLLPACRHCSPGGGIETDVARTWLDFLKKEKISLKTKLKWITGQGLYVKPQLIYPILKFLLYEPLQLSRLHRHFRQN